MLAAAAAFEYSLLEVGCSFSSGWNDSKFSFTFMLKAQLPYKRKNNHQWMQISKEKNVKAGSSFLLTI